MVIIELNFKVLVKGDKKHSQKIQQLLVDLNSGDSVKIEKALKSLKVNGDVTILRPLAELLKKDLPELIISHILEFLGDLKATNTKEEIISILKDETFIAQRQQILSTIWNCTIDYSEYIAEFVEIACDGNFMEAFECLTILDNLEGPFEERHILECQLHLKDYMEDATVAKDPQKAQIMSDIALLIKSFDLDTEEDNF